MKKYKRIIFPNFLYIQKVIDHNILFQELYTTAFNHHLVHILSQDFGMEIMADDHTYTDITCTFTQSLATNTHAYSVAILIHWTNLHSDMNSQLNTLAVSNKKQTFKRQRESTIFRLIYTHISDNKHNITLHKQLEEEAAFHCKSFY